MITLSARALATWTAEWRTGSGTAYRALADRIRAMILDGRVPLDARLPAERELAAALGVSRTTVSAAYADLRSLGYLESRRGSGSVARLPRREAAADLDPAVGLIDLSRAAMPAHPAVAPAAERALTRLPSHLGESGFDAVGIHAARAAIAERYTRRGLPTRPDQVIVTVGAQSAISHLARTLVSRGDRVLVEAPTYPHALEAIRNAGGRPLAVPVSTEDGWDAELLEQAIRGGSPTMAYLMPDYQNPTGRVMPDDLRERTIALAAAHGTVLVVDETMAELGIDGKPATPFAWLADPRAGVVTVGSIGKSVWGGLRIGWIRGPRSLLERVARARFAENLGTPVFEQLVTAELMPLLDGILEDRRALLRAGYETLARRLGELLPEWRVPSVAGGLTAWIGLGAPIATPVALAARQRGVVIASGSRFGLDGAFERHLRIPFSLPPDQLEAGLEGLAAAWEDVRRGTVSSGVDLAQIA